MVCLPGFDYTYKMSAGCFPTEIAMVGKVRKESLKGKG